MSEEVLSSLAKARAIFRKHIAEQEKEGRPTNPVAWINPSDNRLVVVVHGYLGERAIMKPYEYALGFTCGGVHEITEPAARIKGHRKKKEGRPAPAKLRQLHMFKPG